MLQRKDLTVEQQTHCVEEIILYVEGCIHIVDRFMGRVEWVAWTVGILQIEGTN